MPRNVKSDSGAPTRIRRDSGDRPLRTQRRSTRWVLGLLVAIALAAIGVAPAGGQDPGGPRSEADALRDLYRTTAVDRAVDRGLEWLRGRQNADGSFGVAHRNAMTALALLAFLARGHVPGDDPAGQAAARGIDYLLADPRLGSDGYLGATDGSRMYGHGMAMLLLGEVLGMGASSGQDERALAALRRGVELILRAQDVEKLPRDAGGWRYQPEDRASDLSITVWMVMALRAAKNAGADVPTTAIDRAVGYIRGCFDRTHGAFVYRPGRGPTVSMAAAGLVSLRVCGIYSGREHDATADWLLEHSDDYRRSAWKEPWFYYGIYYYAQAMHQLGGRHAETGRDIVQELLLSRQAPDGSWPEPPQWKAERDAGPVYATAMAILALAVDYRFLPIYQR